MSEIREHIMKAQVMYQVKSITVRDVLSKIQELYDVGQTHKAIIYQRRLDKIDNEKDKKKGGSKKMKLQIESAR